MIRIMKIRILSAKDHLKILSILILAVLITGCIPVKYADLARDLKEAYPGQPEGYLSSFELPNSKSLLPPPPQPGSLAMKVDQEISDMYLNSVDSIRRRQAQVDANLDFPTGIDSFAEILHTKISLESAPHLYVLLTRVVDDASLSTASAKIYYMRQRPFIVNEQPTCDPESEPYLRRSGAYPSGHSAIGWTWALILCEIFPEQTNEILIRGREFGESRVVCNLHWHSDVVEGRFMGSATVAALHGNSEFQHDLKKAKQEVKRIISKNR